jgi:S-adenosylmethionine:tRNA ribosyltransferase-isomerase
MMVGHGAMPHPLASRPVGLAWYRGEGWRFATWGGDPSRTHANMADPCGPRDCGYECGYKATGSRETPNDSRTLQCHWMPTPGTTRMTHLVGKAMVLTRNDFYYELPRGLIAQSPPASRRDSRLLVFDPRTDHIAHACFADIGRWLEPGDLLVVNDTRVIPARLHARKDSGGEAELLLERLDDAHVARFQVRASKPLQPGRTLQIGGRGDAAVTVHVLGRAGEFYRLRFEQPVMDVLRRHGEVPLPPYIERAPGADDHARYQTVYARHDGAVAAPTAGLHFDAALLDALSAQRVDLASVTLHVGAGTFQPMRVNDVAAHRMHAERIELPADTVAAVARCRARGGRVVAVGTTVVRVLEAVARGGELVSYNGETDLFIRPGFEFRVVDALITNFHLPESTLLMLVCAFAGRTRMLAAYEAAVSARYRFFSYGDAMLITARGEPDAV